MKVHRTAVIAHRVVRQLLRDRRTLAIILVQPLIIMAIFGYAFGGDVSGVKVAVANLDRGTIAADVLERMDPETVVLVEMLNEAQVEDAVLSGRVAVGILFPTNFTNNLEGALGGGDDPSSIRVFKDNTNPQLAGAVLEALSDALDDALEERFDRTGSFEIEERVLFGPEDERTLDFLVPGVAAYSIFMLGAMLTVVAIVKERTSGTLPRLLASPATPGEIVTGYTAAFGLLALAQAIAVLLVSALIFGVEIRGNILLALLATTLTGFTALGLGILVSGIAENEFQAVQSVFFVALPSLFLAGVFAPIESMPPFMRPAAKVVPLSYAVTAMRDVINRGAGLLDVAVNLIALSSFAVAFLGIAALSFGRRQ